MLENPYLVILELWQILIGFYLFYSIRYTEKIFSLNFIKITQSTGSSKIFILGIFWLREVLNRFHPTWTDRHTIIIKVISLSFNDIFDRLIDIFIKKLAILTGFHMYLEA